MKSLATELRGPDTSADAYVWSVSCRLSTENRQNFFNSSEISRFRSLKNRTSLNILENLQEDPGVMGSTEVRPSTPNCIGYVNIHFYFAKKAFFCKKSKIFPIYIRHFLNDQ